MDNVFVLAGVPKVMQAMLESVRPRLKGGQKIWTQTLTVHAPESQIAPELGVIQEDHDTTSIGSYPFYHTGTPGAQIVIRSADKGAIEAAMAAVRELCTVKAFHIEAPEAIA